MKTKNLILCALFAALTAVGAFIRLPLGHTIITLQFFFTALAGILLGSKLGAVSQALYLALGLIGLPIFTAGGGFGYVFNPTFGFLLGLVPTAWLIGRLTCKNRTKRHIVLACFFGLLLLYAIGLPYIALIVNLYNAGNVSAVTLATAYMLPYLPGDCFKVFACAAVAPQLLHALNKNL